MKYFKVTFILFLIWQASFAQDADTVATFKIRKPEVKKPVARVYTTGEWCGVSFPSRGIGTAYPSNRSFRYSFKVNSDFSKGGKVNEIVLDLEYPPAAIDSGITGSVKVNYDVRKNGKPIDLKLDKSAHPLLNEAALDYVRNQTARPDNSLDWVKKDGERGRIAGYFITLRFALE